MRLDKRQIEVLDEAMAEVLQGKMPLDRLDIADGIRQSARQLIIAGLRQQHPDWSEIDISAEVSKRLSRETH